MAGGEGSGYIIRALVANSLIALAKGVGAFFTGSSAMLAETLHSLSDCGNQLLLLLGLKRSKRPPSPDYPLGEGRQLYFWSFMVAMLLFLGGGAYSLYEGFHKLHDDSPLESPIIAVAILGFSLVVEMWAMYGALKAVNARRAGRPLVRYLRESKDSDLVVIFGEDLAACLGLALALIAVVIAWITGNPMWDAVGTLAIGTVLIAIAVFLAIEVKSLLLGEAADTALNARIETIVKSNPNITGVLRLITVQQGPGEILVAMKLHMKAGISIGEAVRAINAVEDQLQTEMPELKWLFVEPDVPREPAVSAS